LTKISSFGLSDRALYIDPRSRLWKCHQQKRPQRRRGHSTHASCNVDGTRGSRHRSRCCV